MSKNNFGSGNGMAGLFDDAEYVSVHTRAEMLEDGDLVDLNQFIPVKESGYKYPVACTSAVWNIIDRAVKNKRYRNDYRGVVWDVLNMSRLYPVKRWETGQLFEVLITGVGNKNGRNGSFRFKIECTGGDDLAPVMTISMPEED